MSSLTLFDPLLCSEEPPFTEEEPIPISSDSTELLSSLLANQPHASNFTLDDPYLHSSRQQSIQWIKLSGSHFNFSPLTILLAVNYLDRCCFLSSPSPSPPLRLQQDKPWMAQLSAVACLSLAAKIEETHVPFLLNLQSLTPTEFVFEPKTVKRMELLVLSALNWRLHPVTAVGFLQCILPQLKGFGNGDEIEVLRSCEYILLQVFEDWRWVQFAPSVWAAAATEQVMGLHLDQMQHILDLLHVSKERVEACHGVIVEIMGGEGSNCKRKSYYLDPPSPNGVIDALFSCESSSSLDSWPWSATSSVTSSPRQPSSKRQNSSLI